MKIQTLVCTLAAQIRKSADYPVSLSLAMSMAWKLLKENANNYKMLVFIRVDGTECRRVVSENWSAFYTPKGTGKPVNEGRRLFADLGKFVAGKNCIISTYEKNILSIAA